MTELHKELAYTPWRDKKGIYLELNRSYRIDVSGHRITTTRSIQDLGKRSQACQSIRYPPWSTSSSIASSS